MNDYLEIGKIVNTHGVKGEVKVLPLTDDSERYNKLKWVFVDINNELVTYYIESVKFFKNFVILKFKEVADLETAGKLKDCLLKVDRKNAVKLPKNTFFICDLIDCEVFEEKGNKLGILKDVLKTGSNDVYVVRDNNKKEILVPALKSVVKEVSVENRKIIVELPEGLVDDEI